MMTCSGISFTGTITGIPIIGIIHTHTTMIPGSMILGTMIPGTTDRIITVTIMVLMYTIPHIPIGHILHLVLVVEEWPITDLTVV